MSELNLNQNVFEFPFTQNDFENLREIITSHTGIELPESKKSLMYSRLVRRLRHHKFTSFAEYYTYVRTHLNSGGNEEMEAIVNAMTTNVTHFFREVHHFDHMVENLPKLCTENAVVNIWSSACSIGAEPWSIAMRVHKFKQMNPNANIRIYASDIDSHALEKAKKGQYEIPQADFDNNPELKHYVKPVKSGAVESITGHGLYEVVPELRNLVQFEHMNLLKPFPAQIPLNCHVIFCRNVIIYFGRENKQNLFSKFSALQKKDNIMYIGHSESLIGICDDYEPLGRTIYIKK